MSTHCVVLNNNLLVCMVFKNLGHQYYCATRCNLLFFCFRRLHLLTYIVGHFLSSLITFYAFIAVLPSNKFSSFYFSCPLPLSCSLTDSLFSTHLGQNLHQNIPACFLVILLVYFHCLNDSSLSSLQVIFLRHFRPRVHTVC